MVENVKKERLLEISYGRLMRYIVFAYLLRCTHIRAYTSATTGSNQHMHYVPEEFSKNPMYDRRVSYDIIAQYSTS